MTFAVLFAVMMSAPAGALQRQPPPAPNPLSLIPAFRCTFPRYASTEWLAGEPVSASGADKELSFRIIDVNTRRNSARVAGTVGSVEATAMLSETGLNVIEQTGLGNFILTTIFRVGGQDRVFLAVHSRHLGDPVAAPSVSQYVGTCEPVN